jgi:hypothetical protein
MSVSSFVEETTVLNYSINNPWFHVCTLTHKLRKIIAAIMNIIIFSVLIKHLTFHNSMETYELGSFVARNGETGIQHKSTLG